MMGEVRVGVGRSGESGAGGAGVVVEEEGVGTSGVGTAGSVGGVGDGAEVVAAIATAVLGEMKVRDETWTKRGKEACVLLLPLDTQLDKRADKDKDKDKDMGMDSRRPMDKEKGHKKMAAVTLFEGSGTELRPHPCADECPLSSSLTLPARQLKPPPPARRHHDLLQSAPALAPAGHRRLEQQR